MFHDNIGREGRRLPKEIGAQEGDVAGAELVYRLIYEGKPAPMCVRSFEKRTSSWS